MPCPSCAGTLQSVGMLETGLRVYHCSRCGTMRTIDGPAPEPKVTSDYVPTLVQRCRVFEATLARDMARHKATWLTLGIGDAIYPPDQRMR